MDRQRQRAIGTREEGVEAAEAAARAAELISRRGRHLAQRVQGGGGGGRARLELRELGHLEQFSHQRERLAASRLRRLAARLAARAPRRLRRRGGEQVVPQLQQPEPLALARLERGERRTHRLQLGARRRRRRRGGVGAVVFLSLGAAGGGGVVDAREEAEPLVQLRSRLELARDETAVGAAEGGADGRFEGAELAELAALVLDGAQRGGAVGLRRELEQLRAQRAQLARLAQDGGERDERVALARQLAHLRQLLEEAAAAVGRGRRLLLAQLAARAHQLVEVADVDARARRRRHLGADGGRQRGDGGKSVGALAERLNICRNTLGTAAEAIGGDAEDRGAQRRNSL